MVGGLQPPAEQEEQEERLAAGQGVIFCLEDAQLEVAQVGKAYVLLNCDDHASYLRKHKKDPALYRPDICHQALLSILDSPLNKAGKVKAVYVRTHKNVLISISPKVRLPRTFRRFCGLMAQLLQKLSIRSSNGPDKLLKVSSNASSGSNGGGSSSFGLLNSDDDKWTAVVKGPVTKYLPLDCLRLGFSWAADKRVEMEEYVHELPDGKPIVFVVGAFAHGKIDAPWVDLNISVSEYALSAAYCLARITTAFERKWKIV
ncbi:hypothetical protein QJQ45_023600 [Haematococcus lacustris]|nr:hypothetical protein QJQ45_023600 [Haematococcus lacustris]